MLLIKPHLLLSEVENIVDKFVFYNFLVKAVDTVVVEIPFKLCIDDHTIVAQTAAEHSEFFGITYGICFVKLGDQFFGLICLGNLYCSDTALVFVIKMHSYDHIILQDRMKNRADDLIK